MSKLRRPIRQVQKGSAYYYCVVEDINFGYATVRLSGTGARLTQLPVVGGELIIGEKAIVDYSAGVPPVVRPITVGAPLPEKLAAEENVVETVLREIPSDVSVYAYGITDEYLPVASWQTLTWNHTRWDNGPFMSNGQIVLPYDGYYLVIVHVALSEWVDLGDFGYEDESMANWAKCRILLELSGSNYGPFGMELGFPIDSDLEVPVVVECSGFISGLKDEVVTARIRQYNPPEVAVKLESNDILYPRIMVVRLSRGGVFEELAISGSQSLDGQPAYQADDADIEIRDNEGYLHVTDDAQSYARAIAGVTNTSDEEITVDYQFLDVDYGAVFRVFLRSSWDWANWYTPTKAYEFAISNTGTLQLARIEGGSRTILANTSANASTLPHKLRFQCNGSNIRARVWLASESEPGTWTLDIDDSGGFTTAGTMQLGYFREDGEHILHIDNVSVHAP